MEEPTEMELVLKQTNKNIRVIRKLFTMTMEILLEPTSNKLLIAGNPVKEILLKLNLPDHRSILTDSKEYIKMDMEQQSIKLIPYEVLKLKNIKKDGYTFFQHQEQYDHVDPEVTRSQEGKIS
ncbi:hypothetical protein Tco_0073238 [Tanacetum coccineum]